MNGRLRALLLVSIMSGTTLQGMEKQVSGAVKDGVAALGDTWRLLREASFRESAQLKCSLPIVNQLVAIDLGDPGSGCIFEPLPEASDLKIITRAKNGSESVVASEVVSGLKGLFRDVIDQAAGLGKATSVSDVFDGSEDESLLQRITRGITDFKVTPTTVFCFKQGLLHADIARGRYFDASTGPVTYMIDQFVLLMRLLQSWDRDFRLDRAIEGIFDKIPPLAQEFLNGLSLKIAQNEAFLRDKINALWKTWVGVNIVNFGADGFPIDFGVHVYALHFGNDKKGCDRWWQILDKGEQNPEKWRILGERFPRSSFLELVTKMGEEKKEEPLAASLGEAEFADYGRVHKAYMDKADPFVRALTGEEFPDETRCPTLRRKGNSIIAFMTRYSLNDVSTLILASLSAFMRSYLKMVAQNPDYRAAVRESNQLVAREAQYFATTEGQQIREVTAAVVDRDVAETDPEQLKMQRRVGAKVAALKQHMLTKLREAVNAGQVPVAGSSFMDGFDYQVPDQLKPGRVSAVAAPATAALAPLASATASVPSAPPVVVAPEGLFDTQTLNAARLLTNSIVARGSSDALHIVHKGKLYGRKKSGGMWYQWSHDLPITQVNDVTLISDLNRYTAEVTTVVTPGALR